MFDAILAALPDSSFFEQKDFGANLRDKLLVEDVPFAAYFRGAAVWDYASHPVYPVYSISKTNTVDNEGPYNGWGTAVFSSVETGELLTFPMKDESGKMPMAHRPKPVRPPSNIPTVKAYSVNDVWRTFKPEDFCGGHGRYQAFLRAGNFQSNPHPLTILAGPKTPAVRPFETVLKSKGVPGKAEFGVLGVTFSASPGSVPPKEPGLTLVHGKARSERGIRHFPVHAAFRFAGEWPKESERMPIHILVTERNVRDVDVNTIWIPRSQCRFQDGAYTGHFNFDLADLFIAPGDGISKPPKEAWISAVHRGWQGPIERVDFPGGH
ncbi:MAG: hypothetical protein JWP91_1160 [Fibrobacteres bacterium]|nr:hypothetical protein [Fibrobacterota bacterium]